jgi:uroporphyrinogen-III decarboxylase
MMAAKTNQELLAERTDRLVKAIKLDSADRVPVMLNYDSYAARQLGMSIAKFIEHPDIAGDAMLEALERLGDVDGANFPTFTPHVQPPMWLSRSKLPGRDLPDDHLWQIDEKELMQPEDYDRIVDEGWEAWYGRYLQEKLSDYLELAGAFGPAIARMIPLYHAKGYPVFCLGLATIPFEYLCGGRSMREFMLDLHRRPDKVQAAMDEMMPSLLEGAKQQAQTAAPLSMWVGGWRSASEFLSPRLWDRFVWPYFRQMVQVVAENGAVPWLHFDANWNRDLARLRELPQATCALALDSKTDIFKAKEVLGDHMCLVGDVPPRMLSLGTPDEVAEYSKRLIKEIGPSGFILSQGCVLPPDAKYENVKAMVDAVQA